MKEQVSNYIRQYVIHDMQAYVMNQLKEKKSCEEILQSLTKAVGLKQEMTVNLVYKVRLKHLAKIRKNALTWIGMGVLSLVCGIEYPFFLFVGIFCLMLGTLRFTLCNTRLKEARRQIGTNEEIQLTADNLLRWSRFAIKERGTKAAIYMDLAYLTGWDVAQNEQEAVRRLRRRAEEEDDRTAKELLKLI